MPFFALVIDILVFAKVKNDGFMILWRYFAWANQTLSLFAFLCITAWMFENGKGKWAWIPMIPGCFYTFICVTYIANAHIGFTIPWTPSDIIGAVCAAAYVGGCCVYGKKRAAKLAAKYGFPLRIFGYTREVPSIGRDFFWLQKQNLRLMGR